MSRFSWKKPIRQAAPPRRREIVAERQKQASSASNQFRRGNTIAGSTKHRLNVADPRALKSATPRERIHQLTTLRKRILWSIVLLLVATGGVAIFLSQYISGVVVTSTTDGQDQHLVKYKEEIQQYLRERPLERIRPGLNEDDLLRHIQTTNPEVKKIAYTRQSGIGVGGFIVTPRKPVVTWKVGGRQYFVDSDGRAFEKNFFKQSSLVSIVDNSGVEYTEGAAIASERFLGFVGKIVALSQKGKHSVDRVVIPAGTSRQAQIFLQGRSYPFLVSIDRSAGEQAEDMARVMAYFDKQNRTPRYVDLRVKGKAFFRE